MTALYPRLLGAVWGGLPAEIRDMHDGPGLATGRTVVERGAGTLARWVAFLLRFPKASADAPISVRFDVSDGMETWTRTFGNEAFSSRQFAGGGRWQCREGQVTQIRVSRGDRITPELGLDPAAEPERWRVRQPWVDRGRR